MGEIRDQETARTAVDAALTGHLVLASIHSNDAASSIIRLLDLNIEPYLAATAVVGTLGQWLVRTIDAHCEVEVELTASESMAFESAIEGAADSFVRGQGCNFCGGTGYVGRTGVFEVLPVSEATIDHRFRLQRPRATTYENRLSQGEDGAVAPSRDAQGERRWSPLWRTFSGACSSSNSSRFRLTGARKGRDRAGHPRLTQVGAVQFRAVALKYEAMTWPGKKGQGCTEYRL